MQLATTKKEKPYMKAGLHRMMIIETAAIIADERGIAHVTPKVLAEKLGVKPSSLYKHFHGGLDELHKELMLHGWHTMENKITKVAIGKSKDDAIIAISYAYRNFAVDHKGLFEAMQWYNMYQSEEHLQATQGMVSVFFQVLDSYELNVEQKVHIVRMFRGFLQGFSSIESHSGYGNPLSLNDSFEFALKTILNGIHDLQGGKG
jgi:AcrR family transcriptional regulator